jgi:apolipoprotein N-acyltransferase
VKRFRPLLLAILGGALEALSLPLVVPQLSLREIDPAGHLEWIAWVGLVPALFALDAARGWKGAFGLGLAAGLAYFYVAIYWVNHAMTAFGGLSMGLALFALTLLVLYMAFHWGLAFAVSHVVRARLGWPLHLHLPVAWAAAELSRNYLFSGFPWANLGYTQARHLPVSQLASLFGVYAIAALVVLVNAAVHDALRARIEGRPFPWRLAGAVAATLAAVLAYGFAHLSAVRARVAAAPRLKVGLVQGNINQAVKNQRERQADFILGRLRPLTEEADRAGADLVAWPEATYPYLVPPEIRSFAGPRTGLEPLQRAHLLLGASTVAWRPGPSGKRAPELTNSSFLLRPDLSVISRYAKYHLVPFGEYVPLAGLLPFVRQVVPDLPAAAPGRELTVLRFPLPSPPALPGTTPPPPEVSLAPMICYDAIFPEINVAYADQDPEFLVNPTNDAWYGYSSGPYQFLAIVRLRAIEAGKAVARPAYSGVTAIVLPTGEVAPGAIEVGPVDPDLAPDPGEGPRLLLGEVPRLRGRTLYTSIGDLFAWACAALALACWGAALRAGRSARS